MSKLFVCGPMFDAVGGPQSKQIWAIVTRTNACFHSFKCNCTVELLHNKLVEKCISERERPFKRKSMLYFC